MIDLNDSIWSKFEEILFLSWLIKNGKDRIKKRIPVKVA
jgi:hypothetical protein